MIGEGGLKIIISDITWSSGIAPDFGYSKPFKIVILQKSLKEQRPMCVNGRIQLGVRGLCYQKSVARLPHAKGKAHNIPGSIPCTITQQAPLPVKSIATVATKSSPLVWIRFTVLDTWASSVSAKISMSGVQSAYWPRTHYKRVPPHKRS